MVLPFRYAASNHVTKAATQCGAHMTCELRLFWFRPSSHLYWCTEMMPTDVMLLKTYDSHGNEEIAQLAPHSAFKNPLAPANARPRESIEVRAMVFFD
jgi:hypothetical protein